MSDKLIEQARLLREEANELLRSSQLLETLSRYGEVLVHGSYRYDLMTWRDLDIFLAPAALNSASAFALGGELALSLKPVEMLFIDSMHNPDSPLSGLEALYWGLELPAPTQRNWKLDVCLVGQELLSARRAHCEYISGRLTDATRATILRIKTDLLGHPMYIRKLWSTGFAPNRAEAQDRTSGSIDPVFYSADVYAAVLDDGIATTEEFLSQLKGT